MRDDDSVNDIDDKSYIYCRVIMPKITILIMIMKMMQIPIIIIIIIKRPWNRNRKRDRYNKKDMKDKRIYQDDYVNDNCKDINVNYNWC